jgi:hypothetical protein
MKIGSPGDGWLAHDGVEQFYPRDAVSANRVATGAAQNWSAYGTVVASTSADFVPNRLHLFFKYATNVTALTPIIMEYEIATGDAGSEVPYASFTDVAAWQMVMPGDNTIIVFAYGRSFDVGPTAIPSGTRIAHRIRISQASSVVGLSVSMYLAGYDGGNVPVLSPPYGLRPHQAGVHAAQSLITPSGSTLTVTPDTYPSYGSWVDVFGGLTTKDIIVWGAMRVGYASSGIPLYLQFGSTTGVIATCVARRALGFPTITSAHNIGYQDFRKMPLIVPAGHRLGIRGSSNADVTSEIIVHYEEM